MKLARVVGNLVSSDKLPAYEARKLMIVQPVTPEGARLGAPTMAIDYVGAGPGDWVLVGSAPGLANIVFSLRNAPINELIMAIVDEASVGGARTVGNSVPRA